MERKASFGPIGGELDLLRQIRRRAGKGSRGGTLRLGIGDDCALLRPREDEELAVTTDLSIAGRHFRMDWHPPEAVGHRTLVRGLSDLAAMGARPVAAFLSLGAPHALTVVPDSQIGGSLPVQTWVARFLNGFFALADACKTPLAGGDLAESPVALADVVLAGVVPRGKALLRSGARPGDLLYVTGRLGGAAAGLASLAGLAGRAGATAENPAEIPDALSESLAPHLYPQPRVKQGLALQRRGLATAAIDLSDGLSTDLAHLCEESEVNAMVEAAELPVARGASLEQALGGGEDYELLFTAGPAARIPRAIAGVPITRIGRITDRSPGQAPVMLVTGCVVEPLEPRGWEHFSGR